MLGTVAVLGEDQFHDAGDLSMFVAAGAGAVLHLPTYRLEPLWVKGTGGAPLPAGAPDRSEAVVRQNH
ncbi:hypothetical protein [Streptomyces sp. NPDC056160]|uniref:hypothetical protein n=1 Tax=Streptomyces sp. NPDC056160 TaxID=3345731 RepID=UPI0035DB35E9